MRFIVNSATTQLVFEMKYADTIMIAVRDL